LPIGLVGYRCGNTLDESVYYRCIIAFWQLIGALCKVPVISMYKCVGARTNHVLLLLELALLPQHEAQ
jgi:hypothetical protein